MSDFYDIVIAQEDDKERIADFLRKFYLADSPMNVASGAPPNRKTNEIAGLQFLSQGTSLMALSKDDGRILGVSVSFDTFPNNAASETSFNNNLSSESYVKIQKMVRHLEDNADIWNLTGADRGLYVHTLSVDTATRGKGIAKTIMQRTLDIARSRGYPMAWIICSNVYSIRIARNLGMHAAYTLPFSEYKDENGKPIMNIPYPNAECVVFVEKLN
ncbi:arylalkylamine N-acetyltransferase-like 2 isoform X6 [Periplaneta americana]